MATKVTKLEFLYSGFKTKQYLDRNWMLSVFSISTFGDSKLENVVHRNSTYVYVMAGNEEIIISDAELDKPLFNLGDKIEVQFGLLSNIEESMVTSCGNLIFNACVIDYAFGNKIGYANNKKDADVKRLESIIATRLTDGNAPEDNTDKSKIYIDEYLRFVEGFTYLQGFNFNWVICVTEKILSIPPNNAELKKQIIESVGDKIGQPSVLATVYDKLEKNDKQFLAGDESSRFANGKVNIARRKMFLMQGGEAGLKGGDTFDVATNSLAEGIEVSKFSVYNNVSRAGSLYRGHETQLGGVVTKELIRSTSNIRIVKGDCGTKLGRIISIDETNYERQLSGLSIFTNLLDGTIDIKDKEEASKYIGRYVVRRSPMFCKTSGENFCEKCVGSRLARHPTGVSMSITEIGGILLNIFMSAMHAKDLKVHKVTLDSVTV